MEDRSSLVALFSRTTRAGLPDVRLGCLVEPETSRSIAAGRTTPGGTDVVLGAVHPRHGPRALDANRKRLPAHGEAIRRLVRDVWNHEYLVLADQVYPADWKAGPELPRVLRVSKSGTCKTKDTFSRCPLRNILEGGP
jgi:hypothetical protein